MGVLDPSTQRVLLGIAHALFMNRLHVLRLTEIVRLGIKPDTEDGTMQVPPSLDRELRQQAVDFVLTCFPNDYSKMIEQSKDTWLQPA